MEPTKPAKNRVDGQDMPVAVGRSSESSQGILIYSSQNARMGENLQLYYEFGAFRLDATQRLLLRDGEIVPLTPKVFEILLVLVENGGRVVEKDDLMKRVWPDTFVEEGNLTQNVSLLRKALGEAQNGEQYVETLPRRGYRFAATISTGERDGHEAFPAAIGSKLSGGGKSVWLSRLLHGGRSRWFVGAAFLIIAVSGVAYFNMRQKGAALGYKPIDSIAVLPFASDLGDPETEYLNDKIAESLINGLAQLPKLRVIPRTMVMKYKGREVDPRGLGRELGVRAVVTGRVQRRGETLSIQADLIDVSAVSQIWGQHYERKLEDILLVPEEISREIFASLRLKLSFEEEKQVEAYRLYLKGRNQWKKRTTDGLLEGIDYFRQAIEVDPNYAIAYAGLADCYNMLVIYGVRHPREAFPAAKEAALKALEIDDALAEAHTALAFVKFRWDWDRLDAEREFRLAIRHNPGYAPAHQWYSSYLVAVGRFEDAISEARRTRELEPLSFITDVHLGWILYMAGRYDEAIGQCQRMLEIDGDFFPARRYLGLAYEQKGMYGEAIAEFERAVDLSGSPLIVALLGHAYAAGGKQEEARRILADLQGLSNQRYVSPYTIAAIHTGLGDKEEAFRWLEKAYEERDVWLMNLNVDPVFKEIRSSRRFQELVVRTGLTP